LPEQRFCFYLETIRSHTRAINYLAPMYK